MLWLLLMLPLAEPKTYDVEICELNTIVSTDGTHSVAYWVWWNWQWSRDGRFGLYVKDWRNRSVVPRPLGDVQEWWDVKTSQQIRVRHKVYRETVTLYDREIEDRSRLSEQQRRVFRK